MRFPHLASHPGFEPDFGGPPDFVLACAIFESLACSTGGGWVGN